MSLQIKSMKLAGFDHDLADRVGLYDVLSVTVRRNGSSAVAGNVQAAVEEAEVVSDDGGEDAAPSTPAIDGAACGAGEVSTQLGEHGEGAEASTPICKQPRLDVPASPVRPFTSSALQPIAPATTSGTHVTDIPEKSKKT